MIEWFRQKFSRVNRVDMAVQRRVASLPPTVADPTLLRLTRSANHSLLWFAVAAILAGRLGVARKGAARGLLAIAGASITANGVLKPLVPRRRPPFVYLPVARRLDDPPTSSSFPSGHAASAVAFATAVALDSPRAGAAVAPLAAAVAYSRVHVGVHWTSDVLAGAAVGAGSALLTQRWWPVRDSDEATARPVDRVPPLTDGEGLVIVVNPLSGDAGRDPSDEVKQAFPAATVLITRADTDIADQVTEALREHRAQALGVAGGDGTVATVTALANEHGLPLVLVPEGTLNHFARDVGVYDLQEAVDASGAGEAVAVDLGMIDVSQDGERAGPARYFLNTASLGCYSDLVRLRERWQSRLGKWPAFAFALVTVLRRSQPVRAQVNGTWHTLWILFVGNGPYHPSGMVPAWRPRLDSGKLDVRWLRADVRFSRTRAFFALIFGALAHSHVYGHYDVSELDVRLTEAATLATDGELVQRGDTFTFRVAPKPVPVYRRDEDNPRWADRNRPFHPW
ncbi:MAG TPA: phosphatase PAP2 family protein [Pseudonocardia sp.]